MELELKKCIAKYITDHDPHGEIVVSVADTRNSEVLFLERYYQLLRPNGRLGVVLPESIFDTAENLPVRLFLYRHFQIWAVVSLPYSAFNPFTSTKTCLLFARKKDVQEVTRFDTAWKKAASEYKKARHHDLVLWAIQNKRLHESLMELCVAVDVEYTPEENLLLPTALTAELRKALASACSSGSKEGRKLKSLLDRIEGHFAGSPFLVIRQQSAEWKKENKNQLDATTAFSLQAGIKFPVDSGGQITPQSVTSIWRTTMSNAALARDASGKRSSKKNQKEGISFERKLDKYLTNAFSDVDEKIARETLKQFLREMWEPTDASVPLLAALEHHLDDISAVGEINDVFGLLENQPKAAPFAHVNSWWAFNEIAGETDYPIYLAEAEEIGYKRGKKNREQPRRNDLYESADAANPYFTIDADNAGTLLGRLRAHVKQLQQQ